MTGRPTKLTAGVEEALLRGVRKGLSYKLAAWGAGIHEDTFTNWRSEGERRPASLSGQFLSRLKMAEAEAATIWLEAMQGQMGWQAFAWKLERRYPDDYGKKDDPETTGKILNMLVNGGRSNPV